MHVFQGHYKRDNKDINKQNSSMDVLNQTKSRIAITSGNDEPVLDGGGGENSVFASALSSELVKFTNHLQPALSSTIYKKSY